MLVVVAAVVFKGGGRGRVGEGGSGCVARRVMSRSEAQRVDRRAGRRADVVGRQRW